MQTCVPTEIKNNESQVAPTPAAVSESVLAEHRLPRSDWTLFIGTGHAAQTPRQAVWPRVRM